MGGNVIDQVKELQAEFQRNGLKLYLQGEGEAPSMSQMDNFIKNRPITFPLGSEEILAPLQDALNQKCSVMLMKTGGNWELLIESPKKKKEGCFVATVVFESPNASEVEILREFRDTRLLHSTIGRRFVKGYYYLSPPIASWISDKNNLKTILRYCFFKPLVRLLIKSEKGE